MGSGEVKQRSDTRRRGESPKREAEPTGLLELIRRLGGARGIPTDAELDAWLHAHEDEPGATLKLELGREAVAALRFVVADAALTRRDGAPLAELKRRREPLRWASRTEGRPAPKRHGLETKPGASPRRPGHALVRYLWAMHMHPVGTPRSERIPREGAVERVRQELGLETFEAARDAIYRDVGFLGKHPDSDGARFVVWLFGTDALGNPRIPSSDRRRRRRG